MWTASDWPETRDPKGRGVTAEIPMMKPGPPARWERKVSRDPQVTWDIRDCPVSTGLLDQTGSQIYRVPPETLAFQDPTDFLVSPDPGDLPAQTLLPEKKVSLENTESPDSLV